MNSTHQRAPHRQQQNGSTTGAARATAAGKVSRTSGLTAPRGEPAVQRKAQGRPASTTDSAAAWMANPWMDAAHRGAPVPEHLARERVAGEAEKGGGREPGEEAPIAAMPVPADDPALGAGADESGQATDRPAQDGAQPVDANQAAGSQSAGEPAAGSESAAGVAASPAERQAAEALSATGQSAASSALAGSTVHTVIRGNGAPATSMGGSVSPGGGERVAYSVVTPGGSPTLGNHENTCLPSTASAVLAWDVVEDGESWRPDCQSLTLAGQVNVKPWPNKPSSEEVPNTPNPVDGGNINNTKGSKNHWKAAIDDLSDYNQAGGGAGPNWHDTAASSAHEWAHWNTDYIQDSVMSSAGGNWPDINTQIDALRVAKSAHATKDLARAALQVKVDALLSQWRSKTITRWNAIPDSPGASGGAGYAAGEKVLAQHITAIEAYRKSKKWT